MTWPAAQLRQGALASVEMNVIGGGVNRSVSRAMKVRVLPAPVLSGHRWGAGPIPGHFSFFFISLFLIEQLWWLIKSMLWVQYTWLSARCLPV